MKPARVAVLLVALAALGGAVRSQDEVPRVVGRVVAISGGPIVGAQVYAIGTLGKTDASGAFSIAIKPESEDLDLLVRVPGYALFHRTLSADAVNGPEILVRLEPPRVAVVRVVGEDGKPIRGTTVHGRLPFAAAYSALERADFLAQTDQEGIAVIRELPSDGALIAEVRAPGMVPAQSGTLVPIPEPPPEGLLRAAETVTVTAGRTLRIVVENEAGKPVAGAAIQILPLVEPRLDFGGHASRDTTRGSIRIGATDASGGVSFDLLPANPVTCEVRAPGMLTQLLVVEGAKSPAKPVRVRLRADPVPPPRDVPWRASVAAALEESKKSGLAVFLVMTMDGEKANDWMAGHHYHDPEVVRAAREVVPILSSAFGEGGIGDSDHREKDGKCTRYGAIPCRAHQEIEKLARTAVMQERLAFEVPRHLASTPSGERLFERVFFLSERDLVRLIVRALRLTSPEAALRLARERLASIFEDLGHPDVAVRKRGARALALLASSGDEHAAAVIQGLRSLALPAAVKVLILEELRPAGLTTPRETLRELLSDSDREVRRAMFARIGEVTGDESVLEVIASEIRKNDGPARDALLKALEVERKSDALTVRSPVAGNRWRIVEELIEMPDAGRVQGLDDLLRDVDPPARHRLLRAIGRRAAADPALAEVLVRAAKGPSPIAALRAIAQAAATMKAPNPLLRTLVEAARSPEPLVREEALRGLASCDAPVDAAVLAESLEHPAPAVRIQAALALWRRGDRSGEKILMAAISDREHGSTVQAALRKG